MDQEHPSWGNSFPFAAKNSMLMLHARRLSRLWIIIFSIVLLVSGVVIHSFGHSEELNDNSTLPAYQQVEDDHQNGHEQQALTYSTGGGEVERVILLPIEEDEEEGSPSRQLDFSHNDYKYHHDQYNSRRHLMDLRDEFESWIVQHGKTYHSDEEKERRFNIWSDNHHK